MKHLNNTTSIRDREVKPDQWILGEDTGLSSKTIWAVMMGVSEHWTMAHRPSDPTDFARCYRLLELFPEWRSRLKEVSDAYPHWDSLIEIWRYCEIIYKRDIDTGKSTELYEILQNPDLYLTTILSDKKKLIRHKFEKTCINFPKLFNEEENMYVNYETQIRWESFQDGVAFSELLNKVEETPKKEMTCFNCDEKDKCKFAWDGYNTNGDCLASK